MLITKHFVFLHFQKTGGTFVRTLVDTYHPDWVVHDTPDKHAGYGAVPPEHAHLPVLTFVRNPWDWYVSWYAYIIANPAAPDSVMWRAVFDSGRASFPEMVRAACVPPVDRNSAWVRYMRANESDLYTALFMVATDQAEVGRFETLREDLLAFLARHEIPVSGEFSRAVHEHTPINPSKRTHYATYYDAGLRDLLRERARLLIERYGYEFVTQKQR